MRRTVPDEGSARLIGISGATCSGKTSLASALAQHLGAPDPITNDAFFVEDPPFERADGIEFRNWESPRSLDYERLWAEVEATLARNQGQPVIVEGHLIKFHPPLFARFDIVFELILSRKLCWSRRRTRDVDLDTPDIYLRPGEPVPPDWFRVYFDHFIWPAALRMNAATRPHPGWTGHHISLQADLAPAALLQQATDALATSVRDVTDGGRRKNA